MQKRRHINWVNTLFLTINPILGLAGLIWLIVDRSYSMHWQTWVLAAVYTYLSGLAITAGYHRLFSHRAYKANWITRFVLAIFGASVFEGSVLEWCTDHRNHHLYTDTDRDPYSIKKGFWFAHMGWLFTLDYSKRDYSNVEDLSADPMLRIMHTFYVPIAVTVGFVVPMVIAGLGWQDWLGGLIIAGSLRITFNEQVTFCINSICHMFGKKTYSSKQSACDNWVTALVTYGEGFHNFHHQFPLDYRNGVRFYHYDPAKWLIRGLQAIGCASDLRRVSDQKIMQYRLREQERQVLKRAEAPGLVDQVTEWLTPVKDKIFDISRNIEDLEKQLADTVKQYKSEKLDEYKKRIEEYRQRIKQANEELQLSLSQWADMMKTGQWKQAAVRINRD